MLTPLERFLSSPCEREMNISSSKVSPKRVEINNKDEMRLTNPNGLLVCDPSPSIIGPNICVFPPPMVSFDDQECGGVYDDGLLVNIGEASYFSFNFDGDFGGKSNTTTTNSSELELVVNGSKKGSCSSSTTTTTNVVKGQWTAEEDRLLVKLVKQHGVRKWSQIAKKLVGRIGKQCRERWHNHLRPDIKKDTWSEEEEKLLVEAHEKVGNRWAEIAKRIPGRSENSIKNHWNATKRRQNSKRKSKKKTTDGTKSSQPSILQEYIRRKTIEEKAPILTVPTPSEPLGVDDCMQAMQNFYVDFSQSSEGELVGFQVGDIQQPFMAEDPLDFLLMDTLQANDSSEIFYGESIDHQHGGKEIDCDGSGHIFSDNYLSCLLDGGPSPSLDVFEIDSFKDVGDIPDSSICKKDMDLIEMLSSSSSRSSCSQGSNSCRSFT